MVVRNNKSSPKRKFSGRTSLGHSGVIRAGLQVKNFGQALKSWKENNQEGSKGDILTKGGHLKMGFRTETRTRHVDFALKFSLDTSIKSEKSI